MGLPDIPDSFDLEVDLDHGGYLELKGSPTFVVDHRLPKITAALDPITLQPITINPLDVSVRIKEFPSIRAHVPADFSVGLWAFGLPLVCVRLTGEAQVITEPYEPNPCEICGGVSPEPVPVPPQDEPIEPPR